MPLDALPPEEVPTDNDPFPFGKHKGKPYGKVPAGYLDVLDGQKWLDEWPAVKAYIRANRKAIDKDLED